jgi:small GTP-binding protein
MGFLLSKIIEFFTKSRNNFKIIILGMQNAGKTTILYRLSLGQLVKTTPTIGSNVEELTHNNVQFQAWDLGGQESTRSVWDVYYMSTDAVVYVIDSQDEENFEESKAQFHKVIAHPNLKNTIILIFANKQDLPGAKDVNKLIEDYEFDKIKNHIWKIQSCSALKGEGLISGIKWLSEQLLFRGKNSFPNNPYLINENEDNNIDNKENIENKDINININNNNKGLADNENNLKNDSINDNNIDKNEDKNIEENNANNIEISTNNNEN